jgi:hypothetical protein
VLAYIIEEHNDDSKEPNENELYAVLDDVCYHVTSKSTQTPDEYLILQTLSIHNIHNVHWVAYSYRYLGDVISGAANSLL